MTNTEKFKRQSQHKGFGGSRSEPKEVKVAKIAMTGTVIASILALAGVLIGALFAFPPVIAYLERTPTATLIADKTPTLTATSSKPTSTIMPGTNTSINSEISSLRTGIDELTRKIDILEENSDSLNIISIKNDINKINNRLTILEDVIYDDPQKALSLTLLQRDLQSLRADSQKDIVVTQQKIDNINDSVKWILGIMLSIILGLLGLTVSVIMTMRTDSHNNKSDLAYNGRASSYKNNLYYLPQMKRKRTDVKIVKDVPNSNVIDSKKKRKALVSKSGKG